MAELPSRRKQPTTKYKPSRLRQEINAESTDDEGVSEALSAQVPDSQIVVPETQCEHPATNEPKDEASLSPRSAAMLERNTIKRNTEFTKPSDSIFKKLESPFGLSERTSTPDSSVGFCFEQPKAADKLSQNKNTLTVQPAPESHYMQTEAYCK
jgi:hypothetical protein